MWGRLLIADSEIEPSSTVGARLSRLGVEIHECPSEDALDAKLADYHFDVIVIDAQIRDGSSVEVCRRIRANHDACALLLWTRFESALEAVLAYDAGVDDYFSKSTDLVVVEAKVRRALQRIRGPAEPQRVKRPSGVRTLLERVHFEVPGLDVRDLTRLEERLLRVLSAARGALVTTDAIIADLWGRARVENRNLYEHVSTLRSKLYGSGWTIANVRGQGYRLAPSSEGVRAESLGKIRESGLGIVESASVAVEKGAKP